jgi:pilus assembly protein CpaB
MIAFGGTFLFLSSQPAPQPEIQTRSIVVAIQNIPARGEIQAAALGKADYPTGVIPGGAFERIEEVSGKLAIQPMFPGQIILPQMIIDKSRAGAPSQSNASFLIPEGRVAMAFSITPITSIAGALQAGDSVDVLLTLQPGQNITATTGARIPVTSLTGTEGEAVTQITLQDVLILNVGNWPTGPQAQGQQQQQQQQVANILTLLLSTQDALTLKAARELGQIDLILRRAGDHKLVTAEPVTLEYLNRRFNFNLRPAVR